MSNYVIKQKHFFITFLVIVACFSGCAFAQNNLERSPYAKVVANQINRLNDAGFPLFITGCNFEQGKRLVLVISNPKQQGMLLIFRNKKLIDLGAVHLSEKSHSFLIEANGGGERNAEMQNLFNEMMKLQFNFISKISYNDLRDNSYSQVCSK
jgi:hypothetical protein